jgi:hypothetical protein
VKWQGYDSPPQFLMLIYSIWITGARVPAVTIKYQVEKKEHYTAREGQVSVSIAGRYKIVLNLLHLKRGQTFWK